VKITPSPKLIKALVGGLTSTLHFHRFGDDNLRRAARESPTGTFLVCHFHQSLLTILGPHHHLPVATLASKSRDGGITAAYLEEIGIRAIRGSSSRGAAYGALELMRALREGNHIVLNVDGPRGPFKSVKAGAVELARRCGVPLVPLVGRASREFSFKRSWDRFRVPLPGAQVAILYGEPMWFGGAEPGPRELWERRRRLALTMHALEAQASRLVGRPDGRPPRECLAWLTDPPEDDGPPERADR
jgi:hypothetical protein